MDPASVLTDDPITTLKTFIKVRKRIWNLFKRKVMWIKEIHVHLVNFTIKTFLLILRRKNMELSYKVEVSGSEPQS